MRLGRERRRLSSLCKRTQPLRPPYFTLKETSTTVNSSLLDILMEQIPLGKRQYLELCFSLCIDLLFYGGLGVNLLEFLLQTRANFSRDGWNHFVD